MTLVLRVIQKLVLGELPLWLEYAGAQLME